MGLYARNGVKMGDCSQLILSLFIPLNKFRTWNPIVVTGMSGQGIQRKTASKQSLISLGMILEWWKMGYHKKKFRYLIKFLMSI